MLRVTLCYILGTTIWSVSRKTFRRDEEVRFDHHSRTHSYKRTVKTVEINTKTKKQNIFVSFRRHFPRIITHKSDTVYLIERGQFSCCTSLTAGKAAACITFSKEIVRRTGMSLRCVSVGLVEVGLFLGTWWRVIF